MNIRVTGVNWRAFLPFGRALVVAALAIAIAAPFLTTHGLGSDEAMNYSLAVADGVAQMRAGRLPVLVGQTQYAWNGRIHPLRTAPGLIYEAGLLDAVTGHRLGFWALLDFIVAAALAASVLLLFAGLRRWLHVAPGPALAVTAAFALGPGLLAPAYTGDLYMTVLAAPFAVLVILVNLRSLTTPTRTDPWLLAAGLGGAWWVHAPVAAWLTAITVGLQIVGLISGPNRLLRLRRFSLLAGTAVILAAFPFASVLTIENLRAFHQDYTGTILAQVRGVGFGALLPVDSRAYAVGNFQLGYLLWLLLLATAWRVGATRSSHLGLRGRERTAAASTLAAAGLLLLLVLPVPGATVVLWHLLPEALGMVTNIWPMQRLYLIASALIAATAGLVWTRIPPRSRRGRILAWILVLAGLIWSASEARFFLVDRGFASRRSAAASARVHRADNIDLTVTSYAFLGVPDTFHYGPMDPRLEARLLRHGREDVAGNWAAARGSAGTVVAHGDLTVARIFGPKNFVLAPHLTLEPGRHYLLSLEGAEPVAGHLEIHGPDYLRRYSLEDRVAPHGFGLLPGNRHDLALDNSRRRPVAVQVVLALAAAESQWKRGTIFAHFLLRRVDLAKLPVRLTSFLPLTYQVACPTDRCCLETMRRFIPGYRATVNGRPERAFRAPDGNVMVPVPKGISTVVVRYPGPSVVRVSFWVSLGAGFVLAIIIAGDAAGFAWTPWRRAVRWFETIAVWPCRSFRRLGTTLVILVFVGGAAFFWHRHAVTLRAVGPLRIEAYLPRGETGRRQPILTTGRHGAGTVVFAAFTDDSHFRVGAEIWGKAYHSPPLPVNYFRRQTFVIDSSALYPQDNPAVRDLNPLARHDLLNELRVEWDGRPVLDVPRNAFSSTLDEITVGRMKIGASTAEPRFTGDITSVQRLPIAPPVIVAPGAPLRLRVRFSAASEGTQPICALGPGGRDGLCSVTYLPAGRLQFGFLRPGGARVESAPLRVRRGHAHELRIMPGLVRTGGDHLMVAVTLDGRLVLGSPPAAPGDRPRLVTVGLNAGDASGVAMRFTGPEIAVVPSPHGAALPTAAAAGPCRMIVMFPTDKTGQSEPLVTTGRTGAGDFIYVSFVDAHHVRFGFDHWGVGGKVSEPVALDLSVPHVVEVSMGSLDPAPKDDREWQGVPAARRSEIVRRRWVRLDGRTVLEADLPCYPTKPEEITLGRNRIGGSTCAADFSGVIYSVTRPGLAP